MRSYSSHKDAQESTVSEGTVETLLTLSPSDPPEYMLSKFGVFVVTVDLVFLNFFDNLTYLFLDKTWPKGPLQPYQGRNPCMERNLMPPAGSEEELSRQGNVLVDRSSKHTPQGPYLSGNSCAETQALVPNDFLNQTQHQPQLNTNSSLRPITPIPYVQNVVCSSQQGNAENSPPKHGKFLQWTGGLRKLFESKKKIANGPKEELLKGNGQEGTDGRLNLLPGRETQVLLNKPRGVITTVLDADGDKSEWEGNQSPTQNTSAVIVSPALRPTTLSLPRMRTKAPSGNNRKRLSVEFQDLFASSSADWKLKDPTVRVKTPGDVPASVRRNRGRGFAARFSLYDDRIMSGNAPSRSGSIQQLDFTELEKDGVLEVCIPTMFSSVPYQINTVADNGNVNDSTF